MKNPQRRKKEFSKKILKELRSLINSKIESNIPRGGAAW